ncbi:hypothetical protein KKA77_00470, partial [Patescibacteria group bacterium]|nr:hypothetical protein [Patescibacteria group bacterium]
DRPISKHYDAKLAGMTFSHGCTMTLSYDCDSSSTKFAKINFLMYIKTIQIYFIFFKTIFYG